MSENSPVDTIQVRVQRRLEGNTSVAVFDGEQEISHLHIVPFVLRIGTARVRMDGIAGVWTDPERRRQGHAARMMQAAVETMQAGDGCLSMLYGIHNFYPQFGYATAGTEHLVRLNGPATEYPMPDGWSVRTFEPSDLPAVRAIYERMTEGSTGTAVRDADGHVWSELALTVPPGKEGAAEQEECRVVVAPSGIVAGYVWRSESFWYVRSLMRAHESIHPLVFAEVGAVDRQAAVAVLSLCRAWAAEAPEGGTENSVRKALIAIPPDCPVAGAARLQTADFIKGYTRCGASMARTLSTKRLLESLQPELDQLWRRSGLMFLGDITLAVEEERVCLMLDTDGVRVSSGNHTGRDRASVTVELPQAMLARLALGAFPPTDLLDSLTNPLSEVTRDVLCTLFPERHPHMSLPDRY